ncbi:hypothetical protein HUE56_30195 (plasmid) [Azospirillum oryzae]|uniref:C2H2-type domain-containing protein n=1 Tax=Azospirillum oryzae TaxID=286727 RepID=A0A6N1B6F9_9PROT|nr:MULTISPECIES: hypothetical protein [Azospirillum]KAA0585350.1 hypothetical protein FZ938_25510 [Azospirillum oryzae]PWC86782.1 hypothetical protein TSO5_24525 [Azospirillum sp. TSO5]QCG99364.1 hypothetical protein E6C67_36970 [Azospirillum sp. TSA2s]QKS54772.1 hypothetical protein HUE56_30195 [Azospirillum oryzae]
MLTSNLICPQCRRPYKTEDGLRRHLEERHRALVLDEDIPEITGRSFIFEDQIYDVEGLLALVSSAPSKFPPELVPLDQALLTHVALFERDERRIATMTPAEAEVPILTVGMAGGTTQVIDGLHRIHRRHRDGKRDIAMVFVPHAVAQPFIHPRPRRGA